MAEWMAGAMVFGSLMSAKGASQQASAYNYMTQEQWNDQKAMWEKDFGFKTSSWEQSFQESIRQADRAFSLLAGQSEYAYDYNEKALAENDRRYSLYEKERQPYRDSGNYWLGEINAVMKGDKQLADSPALEYQLGQGQKMVERGAAARGGLYSGAAMKALDETAQGIASQYWDGKYNQMYQLAYSPDPFGEPSMMPLMSGAAKNAKDLRQNASKGGGGGGGGGGGDSPPEKEPYKVDDGDRLHSSYDGRPYYGDKTVDSRKNPYPQAEAWDDFLRRTKQGKYRPTATA